VAHRTLKVVAIGRKSEDKWSPNHDSNIRIAAGLAIQRVRSDSAERKLQHVATRDGRILPAWI